MMKKAQISMEFILITMLSFAVLFSFSYALMSVSQQKNEQKTYLEVNDLGISLQNEFLLASELEDGYTRIITLPQDINGLDYSVELGNGTGKLSYVALQYQEFELVYNIPPVTGDIHKGDNVLQKMNGTLLIS